MTRMETVKTATMKVLRAAAASLSETAKNIVTMANILTKCSVLKNLNWITGKTAQVNAQMGVFAES
jgi:hypothetical protein